MYSDQIVAGRKRSVKDRLDVDSGNDSVRSRLGGVKRQRPNDDKWKHDLFEGGQPKISKSIGPKDLRLKLQNRSAHSAHESGRNAGIRDLREKLSGTVNSQPVSTVVPKPKRSSEIVETIKKNLQPEPPIPETKRIPKPTSSRKMSLPKPDLENFLHTLGLEKYLIQFQAEEVDMAALKHMNDDDLKALGIPMGPRKKIILALESKT